jgi:hypothetical protein
MHEFLVLESMTAIRITKNGAQQASALIAMEPRLVRRRRVFPSPLAGLDVPALQIVSAGPLHEPPLYEIWCTRFRR